MIETQNHNSKIIIFFETIASVISYTKLVVGYNRYKIEKGHPGVTVYYECVTLKVFFPFLEVLFTVTGYNT